MDLIIDGHFFDKVTITTNPDDPGNKFDLEYLLSPMGERNKPAKRLTVENDDTTNSIFMILQRFKCHPTIDDIEIKPEAQWESPPLVGWRCYGVAFFAVGGNVIAQVEAWA